MEDTVAIERLAPSVVKLDTDELLSMPDKLREKFTQAAGNNTETSGHEISRDEFRRYNYKRWILVVPPGTNTAVDSVLMQAIEFAEIAQRTAAKQQNIHTENIIEHLVDIYLEGEPRAEIDKKIEQDNARLRAEYLKDVKAFTAADIRNQFVKTKPKNPSEPASRWKREQRVFAIRYDGKDLFPAFQFADGSPLPIIKKILKALPEDLTTWQVAFWFASGNGWLDGDAPQECLKDESGVVFAAEQLGATIG